MSEYCIYLKMPSYLRQWFIHRHGGSEPVQLVRGSAESDLLKKSTIPTDQHPAFIIQTVDSDIYVIGAKERPYPTVKITRSTGQLDGEPSVRKYEVSFTAKKALALCSV